MGRWTVDELDQWREQAQQFHSVPGEWEGLSYDEGYSDDSDSEYGAGYKQDKPLPASPATFTPPPAPPPKIALTRPVPAQTEGCVNKVLGAIRRKGRNDIFRRFRETEFLMVTPAMNTPEKHRYWLLGDAKSSTTPHLDESMARAPALQVFVSTQTTAVASAPDLGRPRVFFPRSSSLQAHRNKALVPVEEEHVQPRRALPVVPLSQEPTGSGVLERRVRPLPVPKS
ncbi:hypothetical protein FB45DRAFT_899999 [Roridomyces roridus]|uniref:Uncharacterized protein n=1 Tax=Roridomyces roridus TaxID=1738132 RepID=A0AAD7C9F0_9AGAR|nr:hypothetical protein FB45DRAFT_899999 [Roridomyces roridus]